MIARQQGVLLELGGLRDVSDVMAVMKTAFDPAFGESWSEDQLRGMLITPGSWLLLLRIDGALAGFAIARSVYDEAELMLLAVLSNFRGHGFGRILLDEVINEAARRKAERLFLEMRSDNQTALILYEKAGFNAVGQRARYYRGADGVLRDAITMSRSLVND